MANYFSSNTVYWAFNQNEWSAYSVDTDITQKITDSNFSQITTFVVNKGYWALSDGDTTGTFQGEQVQDIDYASLADGWYLFGSHRIDNIANLLFQHSNIKVVWSFRFNQWFAYSSDGALNIKIQNEYQLLSTVDDIDGFWVYIKN